MQPTWADNLVTYLRTEEYEPDTVNGVTVHFEVKRTGLANYFFRIVWPTGRMESYGYKSLEAVERGMSEAFERLKRNNMIA